MRQVQVVLVEDHVLVRAGLCALLQGVPEIRIVGEASDGHEALDIIQECRPDVVLMDITMPGLNGLEVTARVTRELPDVRIIILSMHLNEEYVMEALRAGAKGYLLKDAAPAELVHAIKAVSEGETYLCEAVSKQMLRDFVKQLGERGSQSTVPGMGRLTPRQREILRLIARGLTTKEIAEHLKISVKTVETHRAQLMERLDIHDVAGLVRYAIKTGLVNADV